MFTSIKLNNIKNDEKNNLTTISYILHDTEFILNLNLEIEKDKYEGRGDASILPSAIMSVYSKKQLNVPKNLAMFYICSFYNCTSLSYQEENRLIDCDFSWTDYLFPELNCKIYKPCTLNQIKKYKYIGFNKNI